MRKSPKTSSTRLPQSFPRAVHPLVDKIRMKMPVLIAPGKIKSTGTYESGDGYWYAPNEGATNETGLSFHPGGYMMGDFASGTYGALAILAAIYHRDHENCNETQVVDLSLYESILF